MLIALAVAGGAAIGAPSRYLLDRAIQARHGQRFPWGTVMINLLGSAVLGILLGWSTGPGGFSGSTGSGGVPPVVLAALGTGWCGAFTTYSTFGYETVQLARDGFVVRAIGNVAISVIGGFGMAALGIVLGQALSG
jgi:CrcB protein